MPRKVSLPPMIFRIESLSDGREIIDETFVSDIGEHETLPMKQGPNPPRVMKSSNEIIAEIARAKADHAAKALELIVEALSPKPKPVQPQAPIVEGMRPIGKLGRDRAIYIPADPIRRGR